ncbi:hypothetical protein [Bacillus mesophilum]|nr:hypothetical protein [Bacillus mesophilum]
MKRLVDSFLNPIVAVINVLESKGLVTKEEVNEEIKKMIKEGKKN